MILVPAHDPLTLNASQSIDHLAPNPRSPRNLGPLYALFSPATGERSLTLPLPSRRSDLDRCDRGLGWGFPDVSGPGKLCSIFFPSLRQHVIHALRIFTYLTDSQYVAHIRFCAPLNIGRQLMHQVGWGHAVGKANAQASAGTTGEMGSPTNPGIPDYGQDPVGWRKWWDATQVPRLINIFRSSSMKLISISDLLEEARKREIKYQDAVRKARSPEAYVTSIARSIFLEAMRRFEIGKRAEKERIEADRRKEEEHVPKDQLTITEIVRLSRSHLSAELKDVFDACVFF